MTQTSIFDFEEQEQTKTEKYFERVERLVPKDYMPTLYWRVFKKLTTQHLTKKNAINMVELARQLGISDRDVREVMEQLPKFQVAKIIGDNNGYYVGTIEEWGIYQERQLARVKSVLDKFIAQFPHLKGAIHNETRENTSQPLAHKQTQIQFTGYERLFEKQYAEDFM